METGDKNRAYSDPLPKRHGLVSFVQQSPVSSNGSNEYLISMTAMTVKRNEMMRYDYLGPEVGEGVVCKSMAHSIIQPRTFQAVERELLHPEYCRAGKPSSRCGGKALYKSRSRSVKFSPYQHSCSQSYKVIDFSRYEDFPASSNEVNAAQHVDYVWSIKECIDDVQRIEGVTIQKLVTAGFAFVDKELREVYTCFDTEARTLWVLNNI